MMNEKLERIWVEPGMPGYTDEPNELYTTEYVLRDRFEALEAENEKLRKALDIYQRERDRFKRKPCRSALLHVEVIDENGRSYVKYFCNNVKMCLQDDGYTLKLFLDKEDSNG
jgi:hypothetical protein